MRLAPLALLVVILCSLLIPVGSADRYASALAGPATYRYFRSDYGDRCESHGGALMTFYSDGYGGAVTFQDPHCTEHAWIHFRDCAPASQGWLTCTGPVHGVSSLWWGADVSFEIWTGNSDPERNWLGAGNGYAKLTLVRDVHSATVEGWLVSGFTGGPDMRPLAGEIVRGVFHAVM